MKASYHSSLCLVTTTLHTFFPYAVQTNKNTEKWWLKFHSEAPVSKPDQASPMLTEDFRNF